MRWFQRQDFFEKYFVVIPEDGSWMDPDYLESDDPRIPVDVLDANDAEDCFRQHVTSLRQQYKRQE